MPPQKKILLLEDEAATRQDIELALSANGYRVLATDLASSGWHMLRSEKPDLAIVDIMLPDASGLDFCKKIRDHKELRLTPIIILTARGEFESKAAGFQAGADQYLVKPVPPREILLWVEALLRRIDHGAEESELIRVGDCEIDLKSYLVRFKGQPLHYLTCKEFELFYFLVKKRPQLLSRRYILSRLWHTIVVEHVVDTHLTNLRKKLPQELADKIQTVPGKGYRFLE